MINVTRLTVSELDQNPTTQARPGNTLQGILDQHGSEVGYRTDHVVIVDGSLVNDFSMTPRDGANITIKEGTKERG